MQALRRTCGLAASCWMLGELCGIIDDLHHIMEKSWSLTGSRGWGGRGGRELKCRKVMSTFLFLPFPFLFYFAIYSPREHTHHVSSSHIISLLRYVLQDWAEWPERKSDRGKCKRSAESEARELICKVLPQQGASKCNLQGFPIILSILFHFLFIFLMKHSPLCMRTHMHFIFACDGLYTASPIHIHRTCHLEWWPWFQRI